MTLVCSPSVNYHPGFKPLQSPVWRFQQELPIVCLISPNQYPVNRNNKVFFCCFLKAVLTNLKFVLIIRLKIIAGRVIAESLHLIFNLVACDC
jgi:hypothetical protein